MFKIMKKNFKFLTRLKKTWKQPIKMNNNKKIKKNLNNYQI